MQRSRTRSPAGHGDSSGESPHPIRTAARRSYPFDPYSPRTIGSERTMHRRRRRPDRVSRSRVACLPSSRRGIVPRPCVVRRASVETNAPRRLRPGLNPYHHKPRWLRRLSTDRAAARRWFIFHVTFQGPHQRARRALKLAHVATLPASVFHSLEHVAVSAWLAQRPAPAKAMHGSMGLQATHSAKTQDCQSSVWLPQPPLSGWPLRLARQPPQFVST